VACLQALKDTADIPLEAILVDRSSSDGTVEAVRERFPIVKIVRRPADSSFGVAGNAGLALAEGRFVLLVDPSVTVGPGCVGKLADFLLTRPDMGATCPLLVDEEGELDREARRAFPTPARNVGAATGLDRVFPNSRFGGSRLGGGAEAHAIDAGSSACLLVRRAAVDRVGFLDSDYGQEGADLDLCYRLRAGGWKIYFVPQAHAIRTPLNLPKTEVRGELWARHRSLWTFHHKHYAANLSAFPNGVVWLANWARWLYEIVRLELNGQVEADQRRQAEGGSSQERAPQPQPPPPPIAGPTVPAGLDSPPSGAQAESPPSAVQAAATALPHGRSDSSPAAAVPPVASKVEAGAAQVPTAPPRPGGRRTGGRYKASDRAQTGGSPVPRNVSEQAPQGPADEAWPEGRPPADDLPAGR